MVRGLAPINKRQRVEGGLDRDLCCPHMLRGRARKVVASQMQQGGPHTPAALEREEPAAVRAVPLATG
eukprot:gene10938-54716_t